MSAQREFTFGPAYVEEIDGAVVRMQMARIRKLVSDGAWRTLGEIAEVTGDPEASVSAQLRHLRKPRFGGHTIEKQRRTGKRVWEYRLVVES